MVTLKTDDGIEVTGETLKQASRLLKKETAKRSAEMAESAKSYGLAYSRARENAWIITTKIDNPNRPRWNFDLKYHDVNGSHCRYSGLEKTIEFEHNGYNIEGFLTNGAGIDIAVKLSPLPRSDGWKTADEWLAVGAYQDRIAFEPISYYPAVEWLETFYNREMV